MSVLGFDTSNYTTSIAYFDGEGGLNCSQLLPVKPGELGLRQSDAVFHHTKSLPELSGRLFSHVQVDNITAVGVSTRPRAVDGSYMPCFMVGFSHAKLLSDMLAVPLVEVSHQQGHVAASLWSAGRLDLMDQPHLAWHLSGGTTELLLVEPEGKNVKCTRIGGTTDISAGQLIDRAGVALGMQFPAGPYVEAAAKQSDSKDVFTPKINDCYFSLSGVENQFRRRIDDGMSAEDVCAFVLNTVCRTVIRASKQARKQYNLPILVSGGVAACGMLRQQMEASLPDVWVARHGLGGDNALGCAILAARKE